jgi:thiol-disulfide isomerase/thioredoxin
MQRRGGATCLEVVQHALKAGTFMTDRAGIRGRVRRAALIGAWLLSAQAFQVAAAAPKPGEPAPDFVGYNVQGQKLSLSSYVGKVVVLSFWASWCGPCMKELPILEGIARTAGEARIQVVAVNIEGLYTYRKIATKLSDMKMLVACDTRREAQRSYGVDGIPHMVIIGKDGRIVSVHQGYGEDGVDQVVDDLNRALAQSLSVQPPPAQSASTSD